MYLLVVLVFSLLQAKLIFPGAATQGTRDAHIDPPPRAQLLQLSTPDNTPVAALFGPALLRNGTPDPQSPTRPTVLYFYGNGMCLADALAEFDMFRTLGNNCIAVEYVGYGLSGGKPSEQGCYAAAEAAFQHLLSRPDIDAHQLIAAGWSLGGAVAIHLAHAHRDENRFIALITFSAFTSMTDMARHHYPMFPIDLMLQHRFPSEKLLPDLHLPMFLGHGKLDDIVPFGHSDRLAAAYRGPPEKFQRLILPAAHHNDFFENADAQIRPALQQFLASLK